MKTYISYTLALVMLFFVGCSVEPLEDSLLMEKNLTTETTRSQPFTITGYGDLLITPAHSTFNTECEGYTLIETEGFSTEATLGHFTTTTRICTDHADFYEMKGVHTLASGDELYFETIEIVGWGSSESSMLLIFTGGTGMFDGAYGSLDLVEETDFQSPTNGTYTNQGEGMLMMGRGI